MIKHTPEPWTHSEFGVSGRTVGGNVLLADCYNRLIPTSEMKANARLIAAAPDLLEAAKIAEAYLKQIGYKPVEHLKIIIDAIRKAEGETE